MATSVPVLAEQILYALDEINEIFFDGTEEWKIFESVCLEELGKDSVQYKAACKGVICHCGSLPAQVRYAMEKLMRSKPPKIIIATTTLAQGVNIGISTVIIASPYIGGYDKISRKALVISNGDFWNICGRAGRAFVDGEGKILYAIDETKTTWQINNNLELARSYFDYINVEKIESGLLSMIHELRDSANQAGVSFDVLLELVANNDFFTLNNETDDFTKKFDLIDDALLALHTDPMVNKEESDSEVWVDRIFSQSLAVIQARQSTNKDEAGDIIAILKSRVRWVLQRVDQSARQAIVSSGISLSVALRAYENIDLFKEIAVGFLENDSSFQALTTSVKKIEDWARNSASYIVKDIGDENIMESVRDGWLGGVGLFELVEKNCETDGERKKFYKIFNGFYGYQLPWIISAASQQMRFAEETDLADAFNNIALMVELGLPSVKASLIFLSGIHSRVVATEIAKLNADIGDSVDNIRIILSIPEFVKDIIDEVSSSVVQWLEIMNAKRIKDQKESTINLSPFVIDHDFKAQIIHMRHIDNQFYLTSEDGREHLIIQSTEQYPLDKKYTNKPEYAFIRKDNAWEMISRDPRVEFKNNDVLILIIDSYTSGSFDITALM
jgi:hypothetical protein